VAEKQIFLQAIWSEVWKKSYAALSDDRQRSCDEAAIAVIKQTTSARLRVKPIQPEKYYFEARIGSGDRIIFRVEGGTVYFVDIVKHDDIGRYGRRPRRVGP
jgi:mRNA-degrading endonuclease RelE of RelBE toxin-antitoxin system